MGPDESGFLQQAVTPVPDQVRDDGSGFLQQAVTPQLIRGPSVRVTPGNRPRVHFDRLKVAGDISALSGNSSAVSFR
jgi:hypothetical protein